YAPATACCIFVSGGFFTFTRRAAPPADRRTAARQPDGLSNRNAGRTEARRPRLQQSAVARGQREANRDCECAALPCSRHHVTGSAGPASTNRPSSVADAAHFRASAPQGDATSQRIVGARQ